jgi:hypothetical protein
MKFNVEYGIGDYGLMMVYYIVDQGTIQQEIVRMNGFAG